MLRAAGLDHALSVQPRDNGGYSFVLHEPGFWANGEDVDAAVEAEVWKQDVMDKPAARFTDEAHQFCGSTMWLAPTRR